MNASLMVEKKTQINNGITVNVSLRTKIWKNIRCARKNYIWNPAPCSCENGYYLGSIIDDSLITSCRYDKKYINKKNQEILFQ